MLSNHSPFLGSREDAEARETRDRSKIRNCIVIQESENDLCFTVRKQKEICEERSLFIPANAFSLHLELEADVLYLDIH